MSPLGTRGLLLPSVVSAVLVLAPVGTATAAADRPAGAPEPVSVRTPDHAPPSGADGQSGARAAAGPLLDVLAEIGARGTAPLGAAEAAAYTRRIESAYAGLRERLATGPVRARDADGVRAADPTGDAAARLQTAISRLVSAFTSLDAGKAPGAVTGLLPPVLSMVTGSLGSATSSAPSLQSAPSLSSLPGGVAP
ncbi:hypothetical protein [Streptomyces sp. NPDC101249]|uniref:hypothetical protein n=1 Tax=Streptomyces sp. NPDC101249 TaxID=3366140 RepID=UPI0038230B2E